MGTRLQKKDDLRLYGNVLLDADPNDQANLKKGVEILEQVLTGIPHDLETLISIAYNLIRLGDHQKSIEYSKKALKHSPDNLMCLINIGLAYKKLNDTKVFEAIGLKEKTNTATDWEAALIFSLMGEKNDLLKSLKKAIKVNPDIKTKALTIIEFENYYKDSDFLQLIKT